MKLYRRKDDKRVVGTQKDCGPKSNREEFEVPVDKAGLIEFLNANLPAGGDGGCTSEAGEYSLEDFSAWLHIQPDSADKRIALQFIYGFQEDRAETDQMIKH